MVRRDMSDGWRSLALFSEWSLVQNPTKAARELEAPMDQSSWSNVRSSVFPIKVKSKGKFCHFGGER